jgi:hypothetical protein
LFSVGAPLVDGEGKNERRAEGEGEERDGVGPGEASEGMQACKSIVGDEDDRLGSRRGVEGPVAGRELEEELREVRCCAGELERTRADVERHGR